MEPNTNKIYGLFDKIYCVHCAERDDRYEHMIKQLTKVDLLDKCDFWWACYNPHGDVIKNIMNLSKNGVFFKPNEYFTMREQYTLIKTSYLRGMDHILIFEDDNFFLNDKELFDKFMNNIPKDFDIIRLCAMAHEPHPELYDAYVDGKLWIPLTFGCWSASGYGLSRKGMKFIIDFMDERLEPADNPLFWSTNTQPIYGPTDIGHDLVHYISTIPLLYENNEFDSSLRTNDENYNDIFNFYKNIDPANYYD